VGGIQRLNLKSDFSVAGDKVTVDTAKFRAAIDAALQPSICRQVLIRWWERSQSPW
jgi:hypothetical protein